MRPSWSSNVRTWCTEFVALGCAVCWFWFDQRWIDGCCKHCYDLCNGLILSSCYRRIISHQRLEEKNVVAFGFTYGVAPWVVASGYQNMCVCLELTSQDRSDGVAQEKMVFAICGDKRRCGKLNTGEQFSTQLEICRTFSGPN